TGMGYALAVPPDPPRGEATDPLLALMGRIARGDETALGELYDATSSRVYGLSLQMLREREAAEETALDVFVQVWRSRQQYDPARGTVIAWLLTLARTRAIDQLRSRARRAGREAPLPVLDDILDTAPDPEQTTVAGQKARAVRRALRSLTGEQRAALEAAYFGGLSHSEVAESLRVPLRTAETRIRDGLP